MQMFVASNGITMLVPMSVTCCSSLTQLDMRPLHYITFKHITYSSTRCSSLATTLHSITLHEITSHYIIIDTVLQLNVIVISEYWQCCRHYYDHHIHRHKIFIDNVLWYYSAWHVCWHSLPSCYLQPTISWHKEIGRMQAHYIVLHLKIVPMSVTRRPDISQQHYYKRYTLFEEARRCSAQGALVHCTGSAYKSVPL